MDLHSEHEDETRLNRLSELVGKSVPFALPAGYFEELPQQLLQRILLGEMLDAGKSSHPVPEGYFDALPDRIQAAVFAGELKEQVQETGFIVPENYFETLADRLMDTSVPAQQPAKVRKLNTWVSYAAAACITVILGTTVFLYRQQPTVEEQMAKIPEQEIIQYLQVHSDSGDTELIKQNVEDVSGLSYQDDAAQQEIQQYLDQTL